MAAGVMPAALNSDSQPCRTLRDTTATGVPPEARRLPNANTK